MLSSLAPARRRLVLAVLGVVAVAVVAVGTVGIVHALTSADAPTTHVSQAEPGPVVLVPGYGGSTTGLDSLAAVLHAHGKDTTVVDLPGDGRGDLDTQADTLDAAVDRVLRRTRAGSVDVVGYSAGGVVARIWARDHGGASKARRVVNLGSPQHGTDVAALAGTALPGACPTACQQLATGSDLLSALNRDDETPPGPTWVSIWTTHDDVVIPPDSASLTGALDFTVQSVCPTDTVRHGGLPTDAHVQADVLAVLGAGQPRQPVTCSTLSS